MKKLWLAGILVLTFALTSFAQEIRKYDILVLKGAGGGERRLEGKVTEEGTVVKFTSKEGSTTLSFPRSQVIEIIRANTPESVYIQKSKSLPMRDATKRLDLAKFCLKYDLVPQAIMELRRTIAADAKNKEAYLILSDLLVKEYQKLGPKITPEGKKAYMKLLNQELSLYLRAEANKIEEPILLFHAGRIYREMELYTSAKNYVEKAMKMAGENLPEAMAKESPLLQGEIYLGLGDLTKAQEALDKMGDGKDLPFITRHRLMMVLGRLAYKKGELDKAIAQFNAVKELCTKEIKDLGLDNLDKSGEKKEGEGEKKEGDKKEGEKKEGEGEKKEGEKKEGEGEKKEGEKKEGEGEKTEGEKPKEKTDEEKAKEEKFRILKLYTLEPSQMLGTLYCMKGGADLAKAEENLKSALELLVVPSLLKQRVQVFADLALACAFAGKFASAKKYHTEGKTLEDKLVSEQGIKRNPSLDISAGYLALCQNKADEAAKLYRSAADKAGQNGYVYFLAGRALANLGQVSRAQTAFQRSMKYGFSPVDCLMELAKLAFREKKPARAARYLGYIVENFSSFKSLSGFSQADALYYLGRARLQQKQLIPAQNALQKALAQDDKHLAAFNGLGFIFYLRAQQVDGEERTKLLQQSRDTFKKALALDKQNSYANRALNNIASALELKVWEDTFNRPNSSRPRNRWETVTRSGIEVKIINKKMVFLPRDANGQFGQDQRTLAIRRVESKGFAKFEVILTLGQEILSAKPEDKIEIGLILEATNGTPKGKIFLFCRDGNVQYRFEEYGKSGMTKPEVLTPIPKDGKLTLAITYSNRQKRMFQVSVGTSHLREFKASAIPRADTFHLQIYGSSADKRKWGFKISRVRIFRRR